jgi:hypothetical protein
MFSAMRVNGVVINALHAIKGAMDQVVVNALEEATDEVWHGHVWYGHVTESSVIEHIDGSDTAESYVFVGIHQDLRGS